MLHIVQLTYDGNDVESVYTFKYLVVSLSKSGSFNYHLKPSYDKVIKEMYNV